MAEWPESVPVLFIDGPLAGEVHPAPARAGTPFAMLRVRLVEARVDVRSAREQPAGGGWVSYLGLGIARRRSGGVRATDEPWPFVYAD